MTPPPIASRVGNSATVLGHRRSAVIGDLAAVLAVGGLLLAVQYVLPVGVHDRLAFDHAAFAPATLLTAAYVHAGTDHLLSNLGGYVSLAVVTYLICLLADRRSWFRRTVPLLLVALPVAVNLTSYAVLAARFPHATPVSRGFSGVVAGFGGFLLVAVVVHLRQSYARETVFFVGLFGLVLLLGELYWIYAARVTLVEGGTIAVGLAAALSGIVSRARGSSYCDDHYRQVGADLLFVGFVFALLMWLLYGLFPAEPLSQGTFTNVFAHGAGLVEGGLLAALAYVGVR